MPVDSKTWVQDQLALEDFVKKAVGLDSEGSGMSIGASIRDIEYYVPRLTQSIKSKFQKCIDEFNEKNNTKVFFNTSSFYITEKDLEEINN